ncbi:MAG: acetate--CoA ligase [Desulfuromonas sp.]|nr:acetate--CoA ligase [Desulfuromonas sp.]
MSYKPIGKNLQGLAVTPNLQGYEQVCRQFSWQQIRDELAGLPGGGLNIAHEAVDRHAQGPLASHVALRYLSKQGGVSDISYYELMLQSNRFANVLNHLGLYKGDRVFLLSGRVPELYAAALGTWKNGCVLSPLFTAFGPEPIRQRMRKGAAHVLVTTQKLYQKKIVSLLPDLPELRYVLLIDAGQDGSQDETQDGSATVLSLPLLLEQASTSFTIVPTAAEDMAIIHFTSGTTGMAKGAVHVHGAVLTHYLSAKYALDLHPEDIFWCTADPGWVTGTSYGIIAPLCHGVTSIIDEREFDPQRWYQILQEQQVSVWYTAPTAIRMLMRGADNPREQYDLSRLRFVSSVGEPLNPEAVIWGQQALGLPIHDNWWQTETGGIMIANYAALEIRPGSMGRPLPGIEVAIVHRETEEKTGQELTWITEPDREGELALKAGWPSMFSGYLDEEERYRRCFVGDWYLTGDLVRRDGDGYFWFLGRADDIIQSAGHRIGPFEVESVLMEHPAVAEAGVIGKPEPTIGELVKAFVSLKPGVKPSEALRLQIIGFARKKMGATVAPKELDFMESLPKTRSGKIMRRLLKARELGLPEGDISTLETDDGKNES